MKPEALEIPAVRPGASARLPGEALARLWRGPTLVIARQTLQSHARSYLLWGEVVLVLLFYIAFFEYPGTTGDIAYFCGFAGRVLGGLTALSTAAMVQRAFTARAYLPLARLTARGPYARGLLLASAALRLPLLVELFLLYVRNHHTFAPGWEGKLFAGTLGFMANCTVIAAVTLALWPPIATHLEQIVFLAWLVLALSSLASFGPPILRVTRAPLLPLVASYDFGQTGVIGASGLLALAVMAAYVVGLAWLAERQLARRDLLLH